MSLDSEALLMATGLLEVPTRQHVRGADEIDRGMEADVREAFDLVNPRRLIQIPERKTYHDRLLDEPDYTEMLAAVEPLMGQAVADEYVADHQRARAALLGLRPKFTISTVVGEIVVPLDALSQGTWELMVDVVEGARFAKDLGAGALLESTVRLFQACFPTWYKRLRVVEDEELDKRRGKSKNWMPEPWFASTLLVFEGRPPGGRLSSAAPVEPTQGKPTKEVKVKDLAKDLTTASKSVGP